MRVDLLSQSWRARLLRWTLVPVAVVGYGIHRLELKSHSDYVIPPLEQAMVFEGVLSDFVATKHNSYPIVVENSGGRRSFGCEPNFQRTVGSDCFTVETYHELAGKPVRIYYFRYDNARYHNDIVLQLQHGDDVVIAYPDRKKHLQALQQMERGKDAASTVPLSLLMAFSLLVGIECAGWYRRFRIYLAARRS